MGIDGIIEPIYFLITSIGFVILSVIQYKKAGKTFETKRNRFSDVGQSKHMFS